MRSIWRTYSSNAQLQSALQRFRQRGQSIAFVPTMGNLREGHLNLVRKARALCDVVVVNVCRESPAIRPQRRPRCLSRMAADKEKLFSGRAGAVRAKSRGNLPEGMSTPARCGCRPGHPLRQDRPSHFGGVTTVVANCSTSCSRTSRYSAKDFRSCPSSAKWSGTCAYRCKIVGVATTRDEDGLAKAPRATDLSPEQRHIAPGDSPDPEQLPRSYCQWF